MTRSVKEWASWQITVHVPWSKPGSLTRGGGEILRGIPTACATCKFTYLARGPLHLFFKQSVIAFDHGLPCVKIMDRWILTLRVYSTSRYLCRLRIFAVFHWGLVRIDLIPILQGYMPGTERELYVECTSVQYFSYLSIQLNEQQQWTRIYI